IKRVKINIERGTRVVTILHHLHRQKVVTDPTQTANHQNPPGNKTTANEAFQRYYIGSLGLHQLHRLRLCSSIGEYQSPRSHPKPSHQTRRHPHTRKKTLAYTYKRLDTIAGDQHRRRRHGPRVKSQSSTIRRCDIGTNPDMQTQQSQRCRKEINRDTDKQTYKMKHKAKKKKRGW
ncbi:unnamed protein product, partial [Brassica rapa]